MSPGFGYYCKGMASRSLWVGGGSSQMGLVTLPPSREELRIDALPGKTRKARRISSLGIRKRQEPLLMLNAGLEQEPGSYGGKALRTGDSTTCSFELGKRLSELSTWGIGGPAKYFVEVHDESQLASTLRYCRSHGLRYFIVGKGSNCLFDDRGFDGCVILNSLNFLESKGDGIYRAGSGYAFNRLGAQCSKEGYTGLEFASGIPGTVGGAVFMNASANGQETASVLQSVEIMTADAEKIIHSVKGSTSSGYGYRTSPYQTMLGSFAIVAATFELTLCSDAQQRQRKFLERRRQSQPLTERSAGCVFRNPATGSQSAGALIEQAGLKGLSVGQAQVSRTHANFLLNAGRSRAEDMLALIKLVKEQVQEKLGITLTEEIIYVPYS